MALFAARYFSLKNIIGRQNHREVSSVKDDEHSLITGAADIEVIAVPCVGDSGHLMKQMQSLDLVSGCHGIFPTILKTCKDRLADRIHQSQSDVPFIEEADTYRDGANDRTFGEPCAEHYRIWCELKSEMGVDFDLIYTPRTFELLLMSFKLDKELWEDCNILYYHCGGIEGNESQLGRYRFKGMIKHTEP